MADVYTFTMNKKMLIDAWDERTAELTGEPASVAVGKKYYDVFPRLLIRDKDAVSFVIEKQKKVVLKRHIFHCILYRVMADIKIEPLLTARGMKGVAVTVSNISTLAGHSTEDVQRLLAMGKTASSLAHSVRNPLNAIKGAVTYISQKYAQEKVLMEFSKIMHEEISRLDNFISRFLAASVADMDPSLVDINALLRKIEILISFQAHARNIRSDFQYGIIPLAMVNLFQFEQAVLNIINNALEAIDSDGGLTVKTALEKSAERDFIVIEVFDDGPGTLGNKSSESSARRKKGKGYGLAITEEILNQCGGRMHINSRKGLGTSVRLYIPTNAPGGTIEQKRQG